MRRLTSAQMDRACGVLLAAACGDALGAGYEFGSARLDGAPRMIGGGLGGFAPGEWTDDTAQAVAIAEVAATGADLRTDEALTRSRSASPTGTPRGRPTSASRPARSCPGRGGTPPASRCARRRTPCTSAPAAARATAR